MSHQIEKTHKLTLKSRSEGGVVEISVADTGGGIPPGDEEKLLPHHQIAGAGIGTVIEPLDCARAGGTLVGGESTGDRHSVASYAPRMERWRKTLVPAAPGVLIQRCGIESLKCKTIAARCRD